MLYKLKQNVSVKELNPELEAIPEFDILSEKQMTFVILVADRKSPLRTLPEKQRREKATQLSGYGTEGNRPDKNARNLIVGQIPTVEKAILKYREYQFDEQQDSLDVTNKLIRTNREFIDGVNGRTAEEKKLPQYGKDLKLANEFAKELPELEEARKSLESILQITVENKPELITYSHLDLPEESLEPGGEELNSIELFHRMNQKKEE